MSTTNENSEISPEDKAQAINLLCDVGLDICTLITQNKFNNKQTTRFDIEFGLIGKGGTDLIIQRLHTALDLLVDAGILAETNNVLTLGPHSINKDMFFVLRAVKNSLGIK